MTGKGISLEEARRLTGKEKQQFLDAIERDAHDTEVAFWGCSRAVLSVLLRGLNLGDRELLKAASGFPGGIGRMREACGALIGGAMAIGLAYSKGELKPGMVALEQPEEVESIIRTKRLAERFKDKFAGQLRCTEVQQVVRGDDFKGYTRFGTMDAFEDHARCGSVTGPAARMAAEVILEPFELFADEINAILGDLKQAREQQRNRQQ